jgi:hypothetical protein
MRKAPGAQRRVLAGRKVAGWVRAIPLTSLGGRYAQRTRQATITATVVRSAMRLFRTRLVDAKPTWQRRF